MSNSTLPSGSCGSPKSQTKGKIDARYKTIAYLICQGDSIQDVSEKVKMSKDRIYHLLADKGSPVNAEINRILNELFEASNRRLVNLYEKALQKLDKMLSSSDEEKQFRAIDTITKIFHARSGKNGPPIIQQNFRLSEEEKKKMFLQYADEIIIEKRRERGLPELPDEEDEILEPSGEEPEISPPSS